MDTLLSDNDLMVKVKDGDFGQMALIFERHHRAVYGFIFHIIGNREESEDIVQNLFLRMLNYRHSFAGTGSFKTWMYHLARNLLNDYFKKNSKKPYMHPVEKIEEKNTEEHFGDIEKKQELQTLQMAMENLSIENRELLTLCRYEELKYHEIAHLLGITEGAVKVRVHRALSQLKNSYLKIAN